MFSCNRHLHFWQNDRDLLCATAGVCVCVCLHVVCVCVCVHACVRVCMCVNLHLYFSLSLKGCMYTEEGNQTGLVYIHKSKTCKAESQIKATLPEAIVCKLQQAILLLACPFY